jgi:hypothetical protein
MQIYKKEVEHWDDGMMEYWNDGKMEGWKIVY